MTIGAWPPVDSRHRATASALVWQHRQEHFAVDVKTWHHSKWFTRQASQPNFLHETLDVRWGEICNYAGLPLHSSALANHYCDARQDARRQISSGTAVILTNSQLYWYPEDRALIDREHMYHMGWDSDIDDSTVDDGHPSFPAKQGQQSSKGKRSEFKAHCSPPPAKRRKTKTQKRAVAHNRRSVQDLAGNAMVLPDLAAMIWPVILACDGDYFEHPPDMSKLKTTHAQTLSSVDVAADTTKRDMQRAFAEEVGDDFGDEEVGDDPGDEEVGDDPGDEDNSSASAES